MTEACYWVAVDDASQKVVETTGLYSSKDDKNEGLWLGWTCVDTAFRGQGIGRKLVDFAIEKAGSEGNKFLRLYTSNHPNQAIAQLLYDKRGFRIIGEEPFKGSRLKKIYREVEL
ncbi:GNAT family N-acetyltransferase [Coleofasciculus sp. H7-2]|uniref:GNAT family N-acetyltransferase n=1 Tax=Coleofasciculus sp. H7-2 TaxID=3351545 RepID=UPI00367083EB